MNALHVTKDFLSNREMDVINKFRRLDDRGKAAIISQIDHEYIQTQKTLVGKETKK